MLNTTCKASTESRVLFVDHEELTVHKSYSYVLLVSAIIDKQLTYLL